MPIKIEKYDPIERHILTGLIVSNEYANQYYSLQKNGMIQGAPAREVEKWIAEYFEKYKKAPGKDIQFIYQEKKNDPLLTEEIYLLIGDFLTSISNEFERAERFNVQYLLDRTVEYFKKRSIEILQTETKQLLQLGRILEAEEKIAKYNQIEKELDLGFDPFDDKEQIYAAFEEDTKSLFTYPGALGQLLNDGFTRESLVVFMGVEKIGKTWWLMDAAIRSVRSKCNVVFFQAGDMTNKQQTRRIHIHLNRRSNKLKYCGEQLIPTYDCQLNQLNACQNRNRSCKTGVIISQDENGTRKMSFEDAESDGYKPCEYCRREKNKEYRGAVWYEKKTIEQLTWREAYKNGIKFKKYLDGKQLKICTYPNKTLTIKMIESHLEIWERNSNFIPDVIIVDYADILLPGEKKEFRHQRNEIWQDLRALAQKRSALLITATQTDAAAYDQKQIRRKNFSEDKRVYSHATSIITLNQTREEKKEQIIRLAQLMIRDDEYDENTQVVVFQSLKTGRPILGSFFKGKEIKNESDSDSNEAF